MSLTLRILCVVGAAVMLLGIVSQIRKAKIKIDDSIFWVLLSGALLLIAVFPSIAQFLAHLLGFQATSNFVFLSVIAVLLIKEFQNTTQISMLKHRVTELAQELALSDKGDER